jgi:cobalt/nickel transport system permease protein
MPLMLAIDRYAWTNRWREHHPGERLLLAGGGLLLALTLPPLTAGPLLVAVMAGATVAGAGVPARAFLGVMAVPAGFLLAGAPFLALSLNLRDGVQFGWSADGAVLALSVSLRALGATACLACLTLTTPAAELVPWLRRLGVPALLVEIALLVYRLIFLFMERAAAGQQAQAARLGYRDARRGLRSLALLVATLFQRALERARRLEVGLAARGYTGELRVLAPARVLSRRRLAANAGLLLGVGLAALLLDQLW